MRLYYGGAEIPGHRTMLANENVQDVALSFMGLRRRTKFTRPFLLKDKFPDFQNIFVDSGAYTLNADEDAKFTVAEIKDISETYMAFVHQNLDRIEMVSEFDALALGREWIENQREDFWDDLPDDKFLPIWHPEWGVDELTRLASKYSRVGVPQTALGGRNLVPVLNGLVNKYNTRLHGVAMTKVEVMTSVKWDSVASTSWLSPSQFGDSVSADTLIWGRTDEGVILSRVDDLWTSANLREVRTVDSEGNQCWRPASVVRHEISPDKKMFEVSTVGGRSVKVTEDHSLFRLDATGKEEHVLTSDLQVGDRILSGIGSLEGTRHYEQDVSLVISSFPDWKFDARTSIHLDFDTSFCEFLGMFVADGSHDAGGPTMSVGNDPECVDVIERVCKDWGAKWSHRAKNVDVRVNSVYLTRVMRSLDFEHGSANRHVPDCVFKFNREQAAAFLRGYFSGDGCGYKGTVSASSVSRHLLVQVSHLLDTFDVKASVGKTPAVSKSWGGKGSYSLTINDWQSVRNYLDRVGFLQSYKTDRADPGPEKAPGRRGRRWQPPVRPPGNADYVEVSCIQEIATDQYVYDLSVPGPERFWANGIIAHNTIVFTGKELKRYPKKYKEQARKRHRTLFISAGFDAEKIEADDTTEVLRMTIWSWQQLMKSIERHENPGVVTTMDETDDLDNAETALGEVAIPTTETRNAVSTIRYRTGSERQILPVLGIALSKESYVDEDGTRKEHEVPLVRSRSGSLRICDTCFLASKCPGFEAGSNCVYDIPIEVKTKTQMRALMESLVEMQSARVLFMKMAEDIEGGYADPNLSSEIDRLGKLMERKTNMEAEGFSLKIEAHERGSQGGMISRIFGRDAGQASVTYDRPISADRMIESTEVFDIEYTEDPPQEGVTNT